MTLHILFMQLVYTHIHECKQNYIQLIPIRAKKNFVELLAICYNLWQVFGYKSGLSSVQPGCSEKAFKNPVF